MKRGYLAHWRAEPGMAARGLFWRTWHRLHNRILDARALALGACNADTWDPATKSYSGGYSFWRCMRERGHTEYGAHRFHNYIWWGPGHRVEFKPIDGERAELMMPLRIRKVNRHRHTIDTMRRTRIRERADQLYREARL